MGWKLLTWILLLTGIFTVNVQGKASDEKIQTSLIKDIQMLSQEDIKHQMQNALKEYPAEELSQNNKIGISKAEESEHAGFDFSNMTENGKYLRWIDRVGGPYDSIVTTIYSKLCEASDDDGLNDDLIKTSSPLSIGTADYVYYDEYDNVKYGKGNIIYAKSIHCSSRDFDQLINELYSEYDKYANLCCVAYEAFIMDHPEVFWIDYSINITTTEIVAYEYSDGSFSASTTVAFLAQQYDENDQLIFNMIHSKYNPGAIRLGMQEYNQLLYSITSSIKKSSDAEKIAYLNEYLLSENDISELNLEEAELLYQDEPDIYNCLSALRGTKGKNAPMDIAFVRAFKCLCDYLKINCMIETGESGNSEFTGRQYWNLVAVDYKYYAVDVVLNKLQTILNPTQSQNCLLAGDNTIIYFGYEPILFSESHKTTNDYISGMQFTNRPKLEKEAYNSEIEEIKLSATSTNYMYGYMDAPVITAEIPLSDDTDGKISYQWYLIDPDNKTTILKTDYEDTLIFPDVTKPGKYTVCLQATKNISCQTAKINIPVTIFQDVIKNAWYTKPIDWAIQTNVTTGLNYSSFGPDHACTRGQIVTFMWRAAGSPKPVNTNTKFTDISKNAYYYEATLWAVENKILTGYTENTFAPDMPCTRSEMVTLLWRAAGREEVEDKVHPYKDVKADGFYYDAMLWAVEKGIAKGYSATKFAPLATVTRAETVTFLYRADGNAEPPVKNDGPSGILQKKEALDAFGVLSYIQNAYVEADVMQSVQVYENHLLVWGSGVNKNKIPVVKIAILDRETGEPLQNTEIGDVELPNVQVCGEYIAVTDSASGKVRLLDGGLKVLKTISGTNTYCSVYVSSDASRIYTFTNENGIIVKDIATGNTTVLMSGATRLYGGERTGDFVSFTYVDKETQLDENAVISLKTGEILTAPFEGSYTSAQHSNGFWTANYYDETSKYYVANGEEIYSVLPYGENTMLRLIANPDRLLAETYDEAGLSSISLYNIDGTFVSRCDIPADGMGIFSIPVWFEKDQGYYMILVTPDGTDQLMFWDIHTNTDGEDLPYTLITKEDTIGTAVSKELYEKANVLSDEYGIKIKIAEYGKPAYTDNMVEIVTEEDQVAEALRVLEHVLANYPEGFLEQLKYGSQRILELYFAGDLAIYKEEDQSYTSASGFAHSYGSRNYMIVDITNGSEALEQTLYHEIMHLIDYRMMFDAGIREDTVYSEENWCTHNPKDFHYAEEYHILPDGYYNDGYDKWFIDHYARTNSKEDRARIMEYAMAGKIEVFQNASGCLEKLEYLCKCIRDTFDTTGWPEETIWERAI